MPEENTTPSRKDFEAVLPGILNAEYPDAILNLSLLSRSAEFDYANAAAGAAHKLLTARPAKDLPKLERSLRERSPYSGDFLYAWSRLC